MAKSDFTETLRVRVTRGQLEAIQICAKSAGADVSNWVRMILIRETEWSPEMDMAFKQNSNLDNEKKE